ncbi:MAG: GAF domain-containing protein [Calditrichaeota bacterium]|nr:MAG: GAF domain-containing protein [Calditrichota bacterium]
MIEKELLKDPLKSLSAISETINTIYDIDELLKKILDIALKTVNAQRGMVLIFDKEHPNQLSVKVSHKLDPNPDQPLDRFSQSVVDAAIQSGNTIISYNISNDERFSAAQSLAEQKIVAAACLPLRIKSQPIGAIYIDSSETRGQFRPEMEPFLTAFAHQAAIAIENAQMYNRLRLENRRLRKTLVEKNSFSGIIGQSPAMQHVVDTIRSVIDTKATVLILGESGTGKELVARALHYNSQFRDKPFVACFCGSLPETLLESELFGHKAGSFTGATHDKKGLFEEANGGTFFLDEIADISPRVQVQLLRVLQEREIKRIGENHTRKIDVRIIAATNKDLKKQVEEGHFREDLFYRLNVITIHMPPLRARGDDVILLAQHFLDQSVKKFNKAIQGFSEEAIEALRSYSWPGNVRELENCIERAVLLSRSDFINASDLQLQSDAKQPIIPSGLTLKDYEKFIVEQTLFEHQNNISETARALGVSRRWLHYRLKEWGL